MRVLIADDSEVFVQRLVAMLTEVDGVEIVGRAGSVAEAAEAVRHLKPDVLILDIRMPGGSGIDVLQGMKTDSVSPIVVMLTNYAYSQYRKECLKLGASFFFDKSADFEKVGEAIQSLIRDGAA